MDKLELNEQTDASGATGREGALILVYICRLHKQVSVSHPVTYGDFWDNSEFSKTTTVNHLTASDFELRRRDSQVLGNDLRRSFLRLNTKQTEHCTFSKLSSQYIE